MQIFYWAKNEILGVFAKIIYRYSEGNRGDGTERETETRLQRNGTGSVLHFYTAY